MKTEQQPCYIIEQWYSLLTAHTASTQFLDLTAQQTRLMIVAFDAIYEKYFRELNYMRKQLSQDSFVQSKQNWLYDKDVMKAIKDNGLDQAKEKLIHRIGQHVQQGKRYFVKLSLRSPKDSLSLRKHKASLQKHYSQAEYPNLTSELQRLALMVTNAEDILQMLCSSQRIKDDLKRLQKSENYAVSIIIREWQTIPSCLQFRIFMKNRKLTAISSYYKSERHQWLLKFRQTITESITTFFNNSIRDVIPYENGVFDIGFVLPPNDIYKYEEVQQHLIHKKFKVTIIQVNPFSKQTGGALFSWEMDKQVLHKGPLTVRLSGEEDFM